MIIVDNKELIITGRLVKTAALKGEWDKEIEAPDNFIKRLKISGVKADIFTFMQRPPESMPKYNYYMEWDSRAVIPITTYPNWYKNQLHQNPRNKMRIAEKKGVTIKECKFDDDLVKVIKEINDETPIRQGKKYPYYGYSIEQTRQGYITFLERARFFCAYYDNEIIGFIKLVPTNNYMRTMGILAKIAHRDKSAMNLLMAKAVEVCAEMNIPYLVYGKYNYGRGDSETLREFKSYLGFESIVLPRYYVPLNNWGSLMITLGLHRELVDILPQKIVRPLTGLRNKYQSRKYSGKDSQY